MNPRGTPAYVKRGSPPRRHGSRQAGEKAPSESFGGPGAPAGRLEARAACAEGGGGSARAKAPPARKVPRFRRPRRSADGSARRPAPGRRDSSQAEPHPAAPKAPREPPAPRGCVVNLSSAAVKPPDARRLAATGDPPPRRGPGPPAPPAVPPGPPRAVGGQRRPPLQSRRVPLRQASFGSPVPRRGASRRRGGVEGDPIPLDTRPNYADYMLRSEKYLCEMVLSPDARRRAARDAADRVPHRKGRPSRVLQLRQTSARDPR